MSRFLPGIRLLAATMLVAPALACAEGGGDAPVSSDTGGTARIEVGATGTVRGPGGAPVAGALVIARSLDTPSRPIPEIAIMSDAQGHYVWPLPPGRYALEAMRDGARGEPRTVTVEAGRLAEADLTLPR